MTSMASTTYTGRTHCLNIRNREADGRPAYSVSVMEFPDGEASRETRYFADPFEPGPSCAQWVEPMG